MNILFLTLLDFSSFSERNIYCDLLRELKRQGHEVYCISPAERRTGVPTHLEEDGRLLKLRIGNIQKTNLIEKGISTVLIEPSFVRAIRRYFSHVRFDMVIYSTPPITLGQAVRYVQKRDGAFTYLLLKDIFPQNAVDIGLMSPKGHRRLLYWYFRLKEKRLYRMSDGIGCMSGANAAYLLAHNAGLDPDRVDICPNSIEVRDLRADDARRRAIREKYDLPQDRLIYVYGGNLGKPQGIPFLMECLKNQKRNEDVFFLIVGNGTEYGLLEQFIRREKLTNVRLTRSMPREDYDRMTAACDVGMIFLDHRFTIPNFPSRILSYMQAGIPVLACTDPNTDVGSVITGGGFGWWCGSDDPEKFGAVLRQTAGADRAAMGSRGFEYLREHYDVASACRTILNARERAR